MTKTKQADWKLLLDCIQQSNRVYIIGNGGSAANAIHFANDLLSCGIKCHTLSADVATITAIGNDFGYEHIFSRQLVTLGDQGNLLIALSGSGNSPNIVAAIFAAHLSGMKTLAIVGEWKPSIAERLADNTIKYGENMQVAENYQLELVHKVYRTLKGLK